MGKKIRDALDTEAARRGGASPRAQAFRRVRHHAQVGSCRRPAIGGRGSGRRAGSPSARWASARSRRPSPSGGAFPISFQVDSDAGPAAIAGTAGDLIEANAVVPTAIRFSEGSSIVLERGGRMRVLALESNGARVLVEKGAADVAIAHRRGPGRWRFEAGPVSVDVTGTRFRVDWSPEQHSFGIELKEGSVIVGGDCLPTPRRVQRGDNLRISCGTAPATTTREGRDSPARRPPPEAKPAPVRARGGPAQTRDTHSSDDGDWRALVAAGHYAEGVRAAERAGWSRVCRSANAVELLSLADAARLSGETSRAVEALYDAAPAFSGIDQRGDRRVLAGTPRVREARRVRGSGALVRDLSGRAAAGPADGRCDRTLDGGPRPRRRPAGGAARRRTLPAALSGRSLRRHGESYSRGVIARPRRPRRRRRHSRRAVSPGAAAAAEARLRVLIVVDASDDPFAERIKAEVSALGLEVVAVEPWRTGESVESLDAAGRANQAAAAIRMIASRKGVEVWMANQPTGRSLLRQLVVDERAGAPNEGLVALQTAELLRTTLLSRSEIRRRPRRARRRRRPSRRSTGRAAAAAARACRRRRRAVQSRCRQRACRSG